ncbi:hypothetical protein QR680_001628 [Steinernema hermaphroditum]|uniref:Uncharacterized protein n=1 Tax=Steinernema hermaphroditum TaxID=289476 RepID=A0AA39GZ44_9BILA|nr:hypothetical protein QR680_001628 [Steinernema hermaphroditum]
MNRWSLVFVSLLLISVCQAEGEHAPLKENKWPKGDYCILKGSNACPPEFEERSLVRLSVQQVFTTEEKRRDGEQAIQLGSFGASKLTSDLYDNLYSLELATCCRV